MRKSASKTVRKALSIAVFVLACSKGGYLAGQQKVSVGFWNVENLFDTIPSRFYNDLDYTPGGRLKWDTSKYRTKLSNLARVIDDAGFDVAGLAEVENEAVLRDLVMTLTDDYNYIHHTSGDARGIDLALLYKGDKFFPSASRLVNSGASREFLHISGRLSGNMVDIIVCHLPSKQSGRQYREKAMERLSEVADSLIRSKPDAGLIIMGDMNCDPSERIFRRVLGCRSNNGMLGNTLLYSPLPGPSDGGMGSYAWNGQWYLFDNIFLSIGILGGTFRLDSSGPFVRSYMLANGRNDAPRGNRGNYPARTFTSGIYTAGYSDHLPVYIVLEAF